MPRTLKIAAVQMDATPAPTDDRLDRAAALIAEAAASGAQLVVLPECFNTGYGYIDDNYANTEPMHGKSVTWMREQAAEHQVHLAGTLLIVDEDEVYNRALLIAPDGRIWQYDKNYPYLWERAYFREGKGITIADTELGKLGMMICWDSAHPDLWERYAGKVDVMVIPSCPPKFQASTVILPDGERLSFAYKGLHHFADSDIHRQAAWIGVPAVHSSGSGEFNSTFPAAELTVLGYSAEAPSKWGYIREAKDARLVAGYDQHTQIIDAKGEVVGRVTEDGDGFTLAAVELADETPRPVTEQPSMQTEAIGYLTADIMGRMILPFTYRLNVRRQWGARMAPVDYTTKVWSVAVVASLVMGFIIGLISGKGNKR